MAFLDLYGEPQKGIGAVSAQSDFGSSVALASSPAVLEKITAPDLSGSSGINSARRCDPHAIRRKFPAKWSGFLRAHFRDAVEVAYVFSVDAKTARLWWEGSTGPQGWAVDFAHRTFPDARKWMEAA